VAPSKKVFTLVMGADNFALKQGGTNPQKRGHNPFFPKKTFVVKKGAYAPKRGKPNKWPPKLNLTPKSVFSHSHLLGTPHYITFPRTYLHCLPVSTTQTMVLLLPCLVVF